MSKPTFRTFEQWFEVFTDKVRQMGYKGSIDKETFEGDYEYGRTPDFSAKSFVREMNDEEE